MAIVLAAGKGTRMGSDLPKVVHEAAGKPLVRWVVDALRAAGCNKIVLSSQLQQVDNEKALAQALDGVDVIVAGGSGTIYVNNAANLLPGDTAAGRYPFLTTDKMGRRVAVVSTEGQYQYVGQLVVDFDGNGDVVGVSGDTQPATAAKVAALWGSADPFAPGTRGAAVKALARISASRAPVASPAEPRDSCARGPSSLDFGDGLSAHRCLSEGEHLRGADDNGRNRDRPDHDHDDGSPSSSNARG
jgi:hypothetical protein